MSKSEKPIILEAFIDADAEGEALNVIHNRV